MDDVEAVGEGADLGDLGEMGGEIRCNCAATELIVEDGAVAGIRVNEKGSEYAIRAKKVVLLADRTKLGRNSFAKCAGGRLDILVTDGIDDEMRRKLEDNNINVIISKIIIKYYFNILKKNTILKHNHN